jgi:hypothetical protein
LDSNSSKNNGSKSPYEILGVKEGAALRIFKRLEILKLKKLVKI